MMPGKIIFSQKRHGQYGKVFTCYKFRSMLPNGEADIQQASHEDPRITPLGRFLRITSLDELPQFWNVLKGDMSLVGTRPPTVDEWKQYEPYHRGRLAVKPGLTGMWQVSGRSDITDFEEVVKLDMEYVKNWNVGMDIKILFKTVGVVLKGSGSK